MIAALQTHAKSRALLLGAVALAGILVRARAEAPPPRTVEGVAAALGAAAGGTVKPDDFLWEERGSFLHDAFVGRQVLFLASPAAAGSGAPRDLYRARARLTRAGRPISVSDVRNLTRTPLGDDRDLAGSGHHVAFATATPDGVQGVTLLDLAGDPERGVAFAERLHGAVEGWLSSGSPRGLGRTEVAFAQPPTEAKLEVGADALVLSLGSEGAPAAVDFATGALQTGRTNPFGAAAQRIAAPPRPPGEVLADFLAATLGPGPAQSARQLFARAPHFPARPPNAAPEGLRIAAGYPTEGGWPPAAMAPPTTMPFEGEGFWHVAPPAQSPAQEVAAPPLLEAIIRPDPSHPAAIVHLIAIDSRRLDLRIAPGTASPEPATGPHGSGRLPRGKEAETVVAAFVAGPVPASRPLGFAGEGRLFAPLVSGAPTLALGANGRSLLGAWPEAASRDAFVALAQGPDALAAASATSAFAPSNAAISTSRAALCRTAAGYLIYAFAASASADSLRAGLTLAGCVAAIHLGAEPAPLGFAYLHAALDPQGTATYSATVASTAMTLQAGRINEPSREELGILTLRDPAPASAPAKKVAWTVDAGTQPSPAWLPGVFAYETEQLGAKVKLFAFMPERFHFKLATGTDEGVARGAKPGPPAAERSAALVALGISVSRRAARRGLIIGGVEVMKATSGAVWLGFDGGRVTISRPGEAAPAAADATEVPLIADEHKLLPVGREVGTQRPRSALCVLGDGTVLVAHTTFDTDEAMGEALLDAGCDRIVGLDRGAHDGVFVHRAGAERAPEGSYEATAIYILGGAGTGAVKDFR